MPEHFIITAMYRGSRRYIKMDLRKMELSVTAEREEAHVFDNKELVAITKSVVRARYNLAEVSHESV